MKLLPLLLFFPICLNAQTFFQAGLSKSMHRLPALELSAGYKHSMFIGEAGLKTNYQEYYSLVYGSAGVETKGKLLIGLNTGIGYNVNIPQRDIKYSNGVYTILKEGYTTQGIWAWYGNVKAGYEVIKGVTLYSTYSYSWKWSWCGVGVRLSN